MILIAWSGAANYENIKVVIVYFRMSTYFPPLSVCLLDNLFIYSALKFHFNIKHKTFDLGGRNLQGTGIQCFKNLS